MPVPLESAWRWDCPKCGTRNYCESEEIVLSREEQRQVAISEGLIENWQELSPGEVITGYSCPTHVECPQCGYTDETERPEFEDGWSVEQDD